MGAAAGFVETGDEVVARGEVEFAFFVFEEGADSFDKEGFADVEELAAGGQIEVEVGGGQGFHFPGMFLYIRDQGVVGGKDVDIFEADTRGGHLSQPV